MGRRALLVCGIVSSLLYVAMNVFVAMQDKHYSSLSQTVSELSAIGAPTRSLWVPPGFLYALLIIAFGWGVRRSPRPSRRLHIVGGLLIVYGVACFVWAFAPMHLRGAAFTLTDTMHIAIAMVAVLTMLFAMGLGAGAFGARFRLYSLASIVILLVFGALTGVDAPRIAANLPTPWIGVWERVNIGVFLLWIVALAVILLRVPDTAAAEVA